ncbi:MAG: hypothetical protein AB7U82_32660 [Blastocatellales bacterium]
MNSGMTLWMVIFALSAICFFVIAGVVAVKGAGDLRELLSRSGMKAGTDEPEE